MSLMSSNCKTSHRCIKISVNVSLCVHRLRYVQSYTSDQQKNRYKWHHINSREFFLAILCHIDKLPRWLLITFGWVPDSRLLRPWASATSLKVKSKMRPGSRPTVQCASLTRVLRQPRLQIECGSDYHLNALPTMNWLMATAIMRTMNADDADDDDDDDDTIINVNKKV